MCVCVGKIKGSSEGGLRTSYLSFSANILPETFSTENIEILQIQQDKTEYERGVSC